MGVKCHRDSIHSIVLFGDFSLVTPKETLTRHIGLIRCKVIGNDFRL